MANPTAEQRNATKDEVLNSVNGSNAQNQQEAVSNPASASGFKDESVDELAENMSGQREIGVYGDAYLRTGGYNNKGGTKPMSGLTRSNTRADASMSADPSNTPIRQGTRRILKDDDNNWVRVPYQVKLGESFTSMQDSLAYAINTWGAAVKNNTTISNGQIGGDVQQDTVQNFIGAPDFINKPFFKDTRLGANDAINCVWQFNRDDDIVHPMCATDLAAVNGKLVKTGYYEEHIGEGRVYMTTTDLNQTIAYFTFGVARYSKGKDFFQRAYDKDLINNNNTGLGSNSDSFSLGKMFGTVGTLLFAIPIVGVNFLVKIADMFSDLEVPSTRLYDLRITMQQYYAFVDNMLAEWLVDVGIYGNGKEEGVRAREQASQGVDTPAGTEYDYSGKVYNSLSNTLASEATVPIAMRQTGLSIWDIMTRKAKTLGFEDFSRNTPTLYEMIDDLNKKVRTAVGDNAADPDMMEAAYATKSTHSPGNSWSWSGWFANMADTFKDTALGATYYVGFRVEKGVDASESFSNSTTANPLAEKINSAVKSKSTDMLSGLGGAAGLNTGVKLLDNAVEGVKGFLSGIGDAFKFGGTVEAMTSGAFIDAPEIYASSDFNKSHSLNFQFRSPYGSITSIYQSIMVPMFMILGGALPRAAGQSSYQQPFLCRVYCKGLFSVPLGIIDSVSIKRGSSEFGWTYQNLPTCVDISISIKDLSPAMYMAMRSSMFDAGGNGNSFNEYLLTLAGVGVFERMSMWENMRRRVKYAAHKIRQQYTNSNYWSMEAGNFGLARLVANISSANMIPR